MRRGLGNAATANAPDRAHAAALSPTREAADDDDNSGAARTVPRLPISMRQPLYEERVPEAGGGLFGSSGGGCARGCARGTTLDDKPRAGGLAEGLDSCLGRAVTVPLSSARSWASSQCTSGHAAESEDMSEDQVMAELMASLPPAQAHAFVASAIAGEQLDAPVQLTPTRLAALGKQIEMLSGRKVRVRVKVRVGRWRCSRDARLGLGLGLGG